MKLKEWTGRRKEEGVLIAEDCEMLWMKLDNGKIAIRIGVVYMPQENKTKLDVIKNIYKKIEEEIERAIRNGERVVLMGDLNCKVGKETEGNTDEVSKGGKIPIKLKNKMGLTIINAEKYCTGKGRRVEDGHSSILDYK